MGDDLSLEERRFELEKQKAQHDFELRKLELSLKEREAGREASRFSPLTTTLVAGVVTFAASAVGTLLQGRQTLNLEREKFEFTRTMEHEKYETSRTLETQKQQHELVLKMIGVSDPDQGKQNLKFLVESGLITDQKLAARLTATNAVPLIPPPNPRGNLSWRLAESLIALRDRIDKMAPNRNRELDGTILLTGASGSTSDHAPNANGVVTALDITNDPANGVDAERIVEALRASQDSRISYVVWKKQMFSSRNSTPWKWRDFSGPAGRVNSFHISVVSDEKLYDDRSQPWAIPEPQ